MSKSALALFLCATALLFAMTFGGIWLWRTSGSISAVRPPTVTPDSARYHPRTKVEPKPAPLPAEPKAEKSKASEPPNPQAAPKRKPAVWADEIWKDIWTKTEAVVLAKYKEDDSIIAEGRVTYVGRFPNENFAVKLRLTDFINPAADTKPCVVLCSFRDDPALMHELEEIGRGGGAVKTRGFLAALKPATGYNPEGGVHMPFLLQVAALSVETKDAIWVYDGKTDRYEKHSK